MYDFLYTDLKEGEAEFPILESFGDHLVSIPPKDSFARYLFVSRSAVAREAARAKGMGVLEWEGPLAADQIETLLATCDPVLSNNHTLFLFDMGNVVVDNISMLGKISRLLGIGKQAFIADYLHYDFPLMEGVVSEEQYWQHITHVFGIPVQGNPFADVFKPVFNDPVVSLIQSLRSEGKRVVCASNTILSHWEILGEMGALALFDKAYASHEMGLSKPSLQFYKAILDAEGVSVEQVFFIDDRKDNIQNSRSLGIASLLYADLPTGTKDERLSRVFRRYLSRP
ncbi:MAG: HAD-superfamily hydrolase, subfamily variant 3 [Spirochaeta sp.]|jgi:putative hydrolase of the HAD superfamily|nr:HAD-superfamily hydrolase, subfamily variant 3 [Spirochaeta sp.]